MAPDNEIFQIIANNFGWAPSLPEKDNYVIHIVKKLSEMRFDNGKLVFGGGTSLVKGHKIMRRLSEDIDFRFVATCELNRGRKSDIKCRITAFLSSLDGFSLVRKPDARNENTLLNYELNYPMRFGKGESLRPYIKVEIFFKDVHYAPVKLPINSFYNEYRKLPAEVPECDCVALEDTAIDKISSLLWRISARKYEPADIRHLHDLARLADIVVVDGKFKKILFDVYSEDMSERGKMGKQFRQSAEDVIAELSVDSRFSRDYRNFVLNMSYAPDGENLSYDEALAKFARMLKKII